MFFGSRTATTSRARGEGFILLAFLSCSGQADAIRADRYTWRTWSGEVVSPGSWHTHPNPTCFTSEQMLVDAIGGRCWRAVDPPARLAPALAGSVPLRAPRLL